MIFRRGQSLWAGVGDRDGWSDLRRQHPEALFAGLVMQGNYLAPAAHALADRGGLAASSY